ncbi:AMP-binding protein [Sulfidibacter corallicola]|uniref:AMP-binding protein n=1 Tax=Sulfidibacter corallicola TaxID=2818388 RepID=A0A8A4TS49_SULCO|nr:AMP-binding protein [Sulfidibacter corallicola]QTD52370.1 AMP-binding protein [Sulfidibacter corallicola]
MAAEFLSRLKELGIHQETSNGWSERIRDAADNPSLVALWGELRTELIGLGASFPVHETVFQWLRSRWDEASGPFPAWSPEPADLEHANITRHRRDLDLPDYAAFHRWSVTHRADFWRRMIDDLGVSFKKTASDLVDVTDGVTRPSWLPGAELNIADSCFLAPPDHPAILFRRRELAPIETWRFGDLDRLSNRVANGLGDAGFQVGDAIAIDMAMTPESVAIYLGILKAGCVAVSIADSFTPDEIATRLRISKAVGIFTTDFNPRGDKLLPMFEKVKAADAPRAIVLPCGHNLGVGLRPDDLAWDRFLSERDQFASVARTPADLANILFSSGTTGDPKAIPWSHATPIKCGVDGHLHHDIHPGDVVCWPTNLGWMMGPWLIFAALMNRATVALYCGPPTGTDFCRFVQDAQVTMLGVVPSIVKAWRNGDAVAGLDWTAIRTFSSTGECSNVSDMLYLMAQAHYRPVVEYCGGTEIGGGYLTGTRVQAASPATFSTPALGLSFYLLDERQQPSDVGELFLVPPSIGLSLTLLNKDHHEVYYAGAPSGPDGEPLRRHGDQVQRIGGDYYRALGRADDTMNLGGIKVSSAEIERVLKGVEGVDETAAIAVPPKDGGPSLLIVYCVVTAEKPRDSWVLHDAMQQAIRRRLNPLFKIADVRQVVSLPRTASGKVMRRVLRAEYLREASRNDA